MSEIQTYVPQAPPAPTGALAQWVQDLTGLATASNTLAATAFIPESLRVYREDETYNHAATSAQVTAAILTGHELGLDPMSSLRSIDVIKGTPSLRAFALRGILQAAGHEIWVEEATNQRATVCGRRRGTEHVQRITWTIEDAKTRGLANKPLWRSAPRNMLIARATGEVARLVAADALLGIPYTTEELQDDDVDAGEIPPPAPAPRKARRAAPATAQIITRPPVAETPPRPQDEPPLDDEPPRDKRRIPIPADVAPADEPPVDGEIVEPPKPEPVLVTAQQAQAVRRALSGVGVGTARGQLEAVVRITGRKVATLAEMYPAEAAAVVEECMRRKREIEEQPAPAPDEDRWDEYLATNPVDTGDAP